MKKIFYLLTAILFIVQVNAQTPGGVSGSVLWLKANDGASASAWIDKSGNGNDFSQSTPGNQATLTSNVFNFNSAMLFDGLSNFYSNGTMTGFPTGAGDRTMLVVAKANATLNFSWIFVYGHAPNPGTTSQIGNHNGSFATDFYAVDFETPGYWDGTVNGKGALASFTLSSSNGEQFNSGLSYATKPGLSINTTPVTAFVGSVDGTNEYWSGPIAEILLFNGALSTADRNKVESYLALKYGFSLGSTVTPLNYTASDGTVFWTASAGFQNNVFGIGRDDASGLLQNASNSINLGSGNGAGQTGLGNLVVRSTGALTDKQFVMIGDDANALSEATITSGTAPAVAVGSTRLLRNWKVQNTGAVANVDLSIDTVGLTLAGGSTLSNFRLMIDQDGDGDYTTGTITYPVASSASGTVLTFSGITLSNNAVFTLITQTNAALPATLQSFEVGLQKNKATLTWKTSNEINVDYYSIDYSLNGTSWSTAGTVAARNGAGLNTYSFSQDNLPVGMRYYRIKRVDKDGLFQYTAVKSVRVGGSTVFVLKANPIIKNRLEYNIDAAQSQNATVRVVSSNGVVLFQQKLALTAGSNTVSTALPQMGAGTYLLQVQLNGELINKKFVRL